MLLFSPAAQLLPAAVENGVDRLGAITLAASSVWQVSEARVTQSLDPVALMSSLVSTVSEIQPIDYEALLPLISHWMTGEQVLDAFRWRDDLRLNDYPALSPERTHDVNTLRNSIRSRKNSRVD